MGRNPAVGRQGPRHHAAVIPSEDTAKALEVKQVRCGIGHPETHAADARGARPAAPSADRQGGQHGLRCAACCTRCGTSSRVTPVGKERNRRTRAYQMADKITLLHARASAGLAPQPRSGSGAVRARGSARRRARGTRATRRAPAGRPSRIRGRSDADDRRLPKRGFTNPFRVDRRRRSTCAQLEKLSATEVTPETLDAAGLIGKLDRPGRSCWAPVTPTGPIRFAAWHCPRRRARRSRRPAAAIEE